MQLPASMQCCLEGWFCHGRGETNLSFSAPQNLREAWCSNMVLEFSFSSWQRRQCQRSNGNTVEERKYIGNNYWQYKEHTSNVMHSVMGKKSQERQIWVCWAPEHDSCCPWHKLCCGCGSDGLDGGDTRRQSWACSAGPVAEMGQLTELGISLSRLGSVRWQQRRVTPRTELRTQLELQWADKW